MASPSSGVILKEKGIINSKLGYKNQLRNASRKISAL